MFRASGVPVIDLKPPDSVTPEQQRDRLSLLGTLNEMNAGKYPGNSELTARIASYELAYRMQGCAPEAVDINSESASVGGARGAVSCNCFMVGWGFRTWIRGMPMRMWRIIDGGG